jgi:tRNA (guanine-N7-)-methyltransferase
MRQHVNPLSKHFDAIEEIPPLNKIFENPRLPLHLDIGSAAGDFLFDLALENDNWNYLGVEIREKLVKNAKSRIIDQQIDNLYFAFGNANNLFNDRCFKTVLFSVKSISFFFPDPWFKKKHFKRRVIQPDLINLLSNYLQKGALIFIKTDVKELFEHMNHTISSNLNFQKLDSNFMQYSESFNPNKIKTSREKYVMHKQMHIFEKIYIKI